MTQTPLQVSHAPHSPQQLAAITDTITLAFAKDPTWAPILAPGATDLTPAADLATAREYWNLFVTTAQRYPWTFTIDRATPAGSEVAAATVWYPPGADELTAAEEAAFPGFVEGLIGANKRDEVLAISDLFAAAGPTEPHFYLSLLAAHPGYRGQGIGRKLLAQNLAAIDELNMPTYLESSNPENDVRYQALGYVPHGTIELPSGLTLTTMWREPRATSRV